MRFLTAATGVVAGLAALGAGAAAHADDLSGTDKLRTLYSDEFRLTRELFPVVPVAIAEGLREVTVSGDGGLRVLPEGDGGPEIGADAEWRIMLRDGAPARLRYWSVVWRGTAAQSAAAAGEAKAWKERGTTPHVFEQGTLFAISGEVLDRRELLVGIGPHKTPEEAEKAAESLAARAPGGKLAATGIYTELAERPHGHLEAIGTKTGVSIRNEGVIWFAPVGDTPIRVGERRYFGRVYVTIDRNGTMAVVNAVPEDRLLAGLVPAEIFPSAPEEALKAQAVAARGELLAKIGTRHRGDPYRLCSTTHCQVYAGAGKETPRTTAAVAATRGQVLFAADGRALADTVYSASCGGHGENNENTWPDMKPDPLLRGRPDGPGALKVGVDPAGVAAFLDAPPWNAWCARAKMGAEGRYRWTVTLGPADLARLLPDFGTVRAIDVTERGVSGRARAVRITGARKTDVVRGELRIRQTFGGLKSSLFVVTVGADAVTFRGGGFGHGVGMCQTGAVGMAEAGQSYRDILKHYYPGSVLRQLW